MPVTNQAYFDILIPKVFTFLRGNSTQKSMDNLLDLSTSTFHRLESGYLKVKLDLFIECIYNLDFGDAWEKALAEVAMIKTNQSSPILLVSELVKVWGEPSQQLLDSTLGFSQTKWWRIKTGKSGVTAKDFLMLLEERTGKLDWFLEICFGESFLVHLKKGNSTYQDFTSLMKEDPFYSFITAAMDCDWNFGESREAILKIFADKLKVDYLEIEARVHQLESLGFVHFDSFKFNPQAHKLEIRHSERLLGRIVDTFIGRFIDQSEACEFQRRSYKVTATSAKAVDRVAEEQKKFYSTVLSILQEDNGPADRLMVLRQSLGYVK